MRAEEKEQKMRKELGSAVVGIAALAAAVASTAFPTAVTVNPPAGTETNALMLVTGVDALAVNPGATGGTVCLNPCNTHSGGTTLGSGTLVMASAIRKLKAKYGPKK